MAHKVLAMEALTDFGMGNTVNIDVINGGTVPNAVPEHCRAAVDVRFTSKEWGQQYMEKLRKLSPIFILMELRGLLRFLCGSTL